LKVSTPSALGAVTCKRNLTKRIESSINFIIVSFNLSTGISQRELKGTSRASGPLCSFLFRISQRELKGSTYSSSSAYYYFPNLTKRIERILNS